MPFTASGSSLPFSTIRRRPGTLGDEQAAVGQKREAPRRLEISRATTSILNVCFSDLIDLAVGIGDERRFRFERLRLRTADCPVGTGRPTGSRVTGFCARRWRLPIEGVRRHACCQSMTTHSTESPD